MAARVSQSVVQLLVSTNPAANVYQSVVQLWVLPRALAATTTVTPEGGPGGFRPPTCGCSPGELEAERLRREMTRRQKFPYRHVYPAPVTNEVEERSPAVAVPAIGSAAVVLAYQVPPGFRFIMQGILQDCDSFALPGDLEWTVDVNAPAGVANVQAFAVQGLVSVPVPLGSFREGRPWLFKRAYEFGAYDLIQSKALNNTLAGGLLTSWFLGYLVPVVPLF